jgi:hypothetical protein
MSNLTSNSTVFKISIKKRADHVIDVYIDNDLAFSKGSLSDVLVELSKLEQANAISF